MDEVAKPVINIFMWIFAIVGVTYFLRYRFKKFLTTKENNFIKDDSQAEKVLKQFKNKCETRKALMINAPWGMGKTCFYQTSLKPKFKEEYPDFKIVEISCFGMSSSDDLIAQILNEVFCLEYFSVLGRKIEQILSGTSYFKRSLIPSKLIIVADDFERFSGDYRELLGFFDYLICKKACHVVILCNEEHIKDDNNEIRYHYRDFSEKIIEKHDFRMSAETIKEIMKSKNFKFHDQEYFFKDPVIEHFLKILVLTKNIRIAWSAHIDLIEISKQLVKKLKNVDILEEEKEEGLKKYFESGCLYVIKAVFIKNAHKERECLAYIKALEDSYRSNPPGKIRADKDKYLSDMESVFNHLDLPDSLILYLEGQELYTEEFLNGIVADFILTDNILRKLDKLNDNIDVDKNQLIVKSFFDYFKFIQPFSMTSQMLYTLLVYKVFELKYAIKLNEEETALIPQLESKFVGNSDSKSIRENLIEMASKIVEREGYPLPWECFNEIDLNLGFLKNWKEKVDAKEESNIIA